MTNRYTPSLHDPILTELNQKWRRSDQEIADEMGFDKRTIYSHRVRLMLPVNLRPRPVQMPQETSPPARSKPNPLAVAQMWLGKRLVEKPSGYWLDNVPVNLVAIMRATNAILAANGAEQIQHDPKWVI